MSSGTKQDFQQLVQQGRLSEALDLCQALFRQGHGDATLYTEAGMLAARLGKPGMAVDAFAQALQLQPDSAASHCNLAIAYYRQGDLEKAAALLRKAAELRPGHAKTFNDLGMVLQLQGQVGEAIECYRKAISLQPEFSSALNHLGIALCKTGHLDEAIENFRAAIKYQPQNAEAYTNLGVALKEKENIDEAIDCFRHALRLRPDYTEAYNNLGVIYSGEGLLKQAETSFRQALKHQPQYIAAYSNLANVLQMQGRNEEGEAVYRHLLSLDPSNAEVHSKLLMGLNYDNRYSAEEVFRKHLEWGQQHGRVMAGTAEFNNDPDPSRRLRIGYVSPDFRDHPVAYFIESLLEQHDREQVEIFCYANIHAPDETTKRHQLLADQWRNVCGLSDAALAEQIRGDGIDILVDLAGHTGGNRLTAFAMKPSPVQVTWLGYPNTTGLTAINYYLTDAYADPPGSERYYTETLLRLPHTFACYRPPDEVLEVSDLPAMTSGHITFGSFNNIMKLNQNVLALWAKVLNAVPRSRLHLQTRALADQDIAREMRQFFVAHGVAGNRLSLHGAMSFRQYLKQHSQIDIILDTFPWQGHTNTCHALWMGVPVIVLAGQKRAGRMGVSIMKNLGLPGLIAENPDEYVRIAVKMANGLDQLQKMRKELRQRFVASPVCNGEKFTRDLESVYRRMWEQWCCSEVKRGQSPFSGPEFLL